MAASIIGCSDDLLSEILIRLPAKTLLRFKLVSKQWNVLISDPQFAVNHYRNNSSDLSAPAGVYLYHPSLTTDDTPYGTDDTLYVPFLRRNPDMSVPPPPLLPFLVQLLPPDFAHPSRRVFQSCKGLMLCVFFNNYNYRVNAKSLCLIFNPTTRGFRVLPTPPDLDDDDEWLDGLTLVFNPSESHHYKVVCIKRRMTDCEIRGSSELTIYSSQTNHWKSHFSINPIHSYLQFQRGVFFNGAVFWAGFPHTYYYNLKSENVVVFDLPPAPAPDPPSIVYMRTYYLAESCGRLFYAVAVSSATRPFRVCRPEYYIFEFDSVGMKWSDGRVEYLSSSSEYIQDHHYLNSVMAVSRREEDDKWDFVFSLTTPFTNSCLIITMGGRRVENYDDSDIYLLRSCEYVPSLAAV